MSDMTIFFLIYISNDNHIVFSFVRSNGNRIAHKLATMSDRCREMRVWLEDYPPEISNGVLFDISKMT